MGTPDANGNTLPVSVTQGRLSISAASGKPIDPINVVVAGGIYNPTKATCGYTCETCDGCTSYYVTANPLDGSVSVLSQEYAQCPWTTGYVQDYTNSSVWSSAETSILTIETEGNSQPGLANPVGAGSTQFSAQLPSTPVSMGQICGPPPNPACQYTQATPQGSAQVAPNVTFSGGNGYLIWGTDSYALSYNAFASSGSPANGSFTWSVNPANATIGSPTQSTGNGISQSEVTLTAVTQSKSAGDTTLTSKYTLNNVSAQVSEPITVTRFSSLGCVQPQITPLNGPATYGYTAIVNYPIYVSPGATAGQTSMEWAPGDGFPVAENVHPAGLITSNGSTIGGYVKDNLSVLSNAPIPQNYTQNATQTITIEGIQIRSNTLSWTATGVTITGQGCSQ